MLGPVAMRALAFRFGCRSRPTPTTSSRATSALPGGFGTLDELFEILTWAQLGIHAKPVAVLNVGGFFAPLLALLDHMTAEGLLRPAHRELLLVADSVPDLFEKLTAWTPAAPAFKWARADER